MTDQTNQTVAAKCGVCDGNLAFRWTDTHGIGICCACGAPYTVYHYEDNKRIDKAPTPCLTGDGVVLARRYWAEKSRMVFPGCCDMGITYGRDRTFSGATLDDMNSFTDWYDAQPEVIAKREVPLAAGAPA